MSDAGARFKVNGRNVFRRGGDRARIILRKEGVLVKKKERNAHLGKRKQNGNKEEWTPVLRLDLRHVYLVGSFETGPSEEAFRGKQTVRGIRPLIVVNGVWGKPSATFCIRSCLFRASVVRVRVWAWFECKLASSLGATHCCSLEPSCKHRHAAVYLRWTVSRFRHFNNVRTE